MIKILTFLWLLLTAFPVSAFTPLAAEKAFHFTATLLPNHRVNLRWEIAPGYYLYRDRIQVTPAVVTLDLPASMQQGLYAVYKDHLKIPVKIEPIANGSVLLKVQYQGCAEAGFCYAPVTQGVRVDFTSAGIPKNVLLGTAISSQASNPFDHYLKGNHFLMVAAFLGMGILLSLTPCVLPMVPILSAIIVGHRRRKPDKKTFFLSFTYVLGSAITYAIAGVVIAMIGHNIQAELQRPWVIIAASMVFVLLALSLLGFYDFRLPSRWQQKLAELSYRQRGGTFFGVFLMGSLSTLIVSPCVSAPLVGVLAWIGQTGDTWLGAIALFALGLGMGLPLLLMGLSFDRYLPRTGHWMIVLERFFGVVMLLMAVWMLFRLTPSSQTLFTVVPDMPTLEKTLEKAQRNHQPVVLDFYADWCTSCVAMDKTIFSHKNTREALTGFVTLRVDVTKNDSAATEFLDHFHVIGPPTFLLTDCAGNWLPAATLVGEMTEKKFISRLNKIRNTNACLSAH